MRSSIAIVLAVLVAGCVSQGKYRKKEAEAARYQGELAAEVSRRTALQAEFDAAQAELKAALGKVSDLQQGVTELAQSKQRLELAKAELEAKSAEYEKMTSALKGEIEAGRVEVSELRGLMTVKMKDKVLFASGSATLGKPGKEALRKVAEALGSMADKLIRVEGHTDDVPTGGGAFPSNWELSSARALAVVRYLQESGVDPTKLAAAGYGQYHPLAPNDSPEGRSQNRRIEIVLAPAPEPARASAGAPASDVKM